jgi:outer membrane protein assembly factor BamB
MDYDREGKADALRCLSLADGNEIWRFTYPVGIKRNHGMTRTVPSVQGDLVVAIGPKCQVICCETTTGALRWTRDLVLEFGTTVPEWYTGQCPLIEGDRVILAPGGPDALLLALRLTDGEVIWQTPNPNEWKMTHASIMPMDFAGGRQYVYCANKGVVGVAAGDGALLWETTDWKISIATVPSACIVDDTRLFLTGGYNAGSLMLQLDAVEGGIAARTLFRLEAETFGATQHTPVLHQNHLYGIRADGRLVCLSLDGQVRWESEASETFGLGPLLLADHLIYAMNDSGLLRLARATPDAYTRLAEAQVLEGRESWGPMALAGTRLLVRDFTRLACLEVGGR